MGLLKGVNMSCEFEWHFHRVILATVTFSFPETKQPKPLRIYVR